MRSSTVFVSRLFSTTLGSLFLPEHGSRFDVLAEPLYGQVKEKHAEAPQFRSSDYQSFADLVSNAKEPMEEQFNNVHINRDALLRLKNGTPLRASRTFIEPSVATLRRRGCALGQS